MPAKKIYIILLKSIHRYKPFINILKYISREINKQIMEENIHSTEYQFFFQGYILRIELTPLKEDSEKSFSQLFSFPIINKIGY